MKGAIRFFPRLNVAGMIPGPRRILGLVENGFGEMRGGITQRQHLKRGAHLGHLPHFLQTKAGNANTPARLAHDQPLRFQSPESLAHRHMADAELFGNVVLAQLRAGLDRTGNDTVRQYSADLRSDGV